MRYIGNKSELLEFIERPLVENNITSGTLFDLFAGSGSVSKYFKQKNYQIISNDFMFYSYVFSRAYIENNKIPAFRGLKEIISNPSLKNVICYLNGLDGIDGFIYKNFSKEGSCHLEEPRNYFSSHNSRKIDSIREKLQEWNEYGLIKETEYYILLSSLIEKIPFVSNISGTYGAYLKIDDPRMFKPFLLDVPNMIKNEFNNKAYNRDSFNLIKEIETDILYIDPPYNHRQYATNYHIWETVAVWNKKIRDTKAGLRDYENQKSSFCSKTKCAESFEDLIKNARCKYILFSYNSDGIMTQDTILSILSARGKVRQYTKTYRRFKSNSNGKPKSDLEEWLFFVKTV